MTKTRPIHWHYSQADLICPDGPFKKSPNIVAILFLKIPSSVFTAFSPPPPPLCCIHRCKGAGRGVREGGGGMWWWGGEGGGGWGCGDNCNPPEMCSSLPACQDNRETKTKQHIYKQKFFSTYSLGAKILPDLIMVPKKGLTAAKYRLQLSGQIL